MMHTSKEFRGNPLSKKTLNLENASKTPHKTEDNIKCIRNIKTQVSPTMFTWQEMFRFTKNYIFGF